MQLLTINGETILIITLYGENRNPEVTEWHRKVMVEHFLLPVNYVRGVFPQFSHGWHMNQMILQTIDQPDAPTYYLFLDNDSIFLRREALSIIYEAVKNKMTIFGHAFQSNHKTGPTGLVPHVYVSQACICFPRELYNACGRPDMDHWVPRSDTAEELSYESKARGYILSLVYPSHSVLPDTPLDNGMRYGMGSTYGPLSRPLFHHTMCANHPRHVEVFTETCKMVLANRFEGDNPAAPYA